MLASLLMRQHPLRSSAETHSSSLLFHVWIDLTDFQATLFFLACTRMSWHILISPVTDKRSQGERKGRHGPAADDGLLLTIISLGLWRKTLCEPWGERRRWFYEPLMSLTGCRAKLFFSSLNKILRETFSLNWERTWKVHYPTRQLTVPQYTQSGRLGGTILFAPTRQLTDSFPFLNEKYQRLAISIGSNPDYPLRGGSAFFCFLFPVSRRWN